MSEIFKLEVSLMNFRQSIKNEPVFGMRDVSYVSKDHAECDGKHAAHRYRQ